MDLDQQIQELIDNAPQDGKTPALVTAIAPALKMIASNLQSLQYFVLRTTDQGWVTTTLSNRSNPSLEKKVIYAYPSLADARAGAQNSNDAEILAIPIPVIHILFQMLAMKTVDSIVFLETPSNLSNATEVTQHRLRELMKQVFEATKLRPQPPSDIA